MIDGIGDMMQLPFSDDLEIGRLSRIFDNTSECYKFFWFQALINKIQEGKEVITYGELIDEMIANAWYMVTEYHLNLGPKDTLEKIVHYIREISSMKPFEKKEALLEYLKTCDDKEVLRKKRTLTIPACQELRINCSHLWSASWLRYRNIGNYC